MKKKCLRYIAVCFGVILLLAGFASAGDFSFQPRLETGIMHYAFESETGVTSIKPSANSVRTAYTYNDLMPFVSAGGTVFWNRFFFDLSGQYAFDGKDSKEISNSKFGVTTVSTITTEEGEKYFVNSQFMALKTMNEARFDRRDMEFALGYAATKHLRIFTGYKWAKTEFRVNYDGIFNLTYHDHGSKKDEDIDYQSGRMWGNVGYHFEYAGPFIGFIQGWDFSDNRFLRGMLTASVALASLDGKVRDKSGIHFYSINRVNDQQIQERKYGPSNVGLNVRDVSKGDALGFSFSIGWRGDTAWDGLAYYVGLSGYRYEFDAKRTTITNGDTITKISPSDINEIAIKFKMGLYYFF